MRYVFFGTTDFSAAILERLLRAGLSPALVVTNPDRPIGRRQELTPPPVKVLAQKSGLEIFQPEKLDAGAAERIGGTAADVAILAAYGKILPESILFLPRLGTIGVHVSLLPKYRGAAPMQNAILNGERISGVSLYLMDAQVDHGPILAQVEIPLARPTFLELQSQSSELAADLLIRILPQFMSGELQPRTQDESQATFTRKFSSEDGFVAEEELSAALGRDSALAEKIDRKIRALNPEPGVWTYGRALQTAVPDIAADKRVKLLAGELREGKLVLRQIQVEGKSPRSV